MSGSETTSDRVADPPLSLRVLGAGEKRALPETLVTTSPRLVLEPDPPRLVSESDPGWSQNQTLPGWSQNQTLPGWSQNQTLPGLSSQFTHTTIKNWSQGRSGNVTVKAQVYLRFPPQHTMKGTDFSIGVRHFTHFFITEAQAAETKHTYKGALSHTPLALGMRLCYIE